MRTLIVADVHSNIEALQAVLADAGAGGAIDAVWSLGDAVGYGPDPNACIELLRSFPLTAIAGNHDLAAVEGIDIDDFNPYAAAAVEWTVEHLEPASREWLASLPETIVDSDFTLVHGSLTGPIWDYLMNARDADEHLELQETPYSLVGHSHIAVAFLRKGRGLDGRPLRHGTTIDLNGTPFVANPGSVGQPRDGDPRAAYAILDTDASRLSFHRVGYDIRATQAKIVAAGLPAYLAERLERGR